MTTKRLNRRKFLHGVGISTLALESLARAAPRATANRELSFVHTHTGESLSVVYYQDGAYQPASLERINHLLRDFRTQEIHSIDLRTLDILFEVQVLADRDEPFQVISGYRSPTTNAALRRSSTGVAEHSLHVQGRAIDVRLGGVATRRLRDLALQLGKGGVGFYPRSDFVHLDSGPFRFW
jgi:uncharacterized protein YcbK (DUF882 family)